MGSNYELYLYIFLGNLWFLTLNVISCVIYIYEVPNLWTSEPRRGSAWQQTHWSFCGSCGVNDRMRYYCWMQCSDKFELQIHGDYNSINEQKLYLIMHVSLKITWNCCIFGIVLYLHARKWRLNNLPRTWRSMLVWKDDAENSPMGRSPIYTIYSCIPHKWEIL